MNIDPGYQAAYSKQSFWQKIRTLSSAYKALKYKAILLWLLLKDDSVPTRVKASILVALGYLITPTDLIPDILPAGLVDDGAVIGAVLKLADSYVTGKMRRKARRMSE